MFEELNKKLEENRLGIGKYQRLGNKLNDYRKQLDGLETKRTELKQQFEKEENDYNNLSKKSLNNLLLELLNKKEKKEAKEYQEAVAVKLKLEEAEKQIANILLAIRNLEEERVSFAGCENTYRKLYEQKYKLMAENVPINSEKIKTAEEQIHSLSQNLTEIDEAVKAGNLVLNKIKDTEESLDDAHGWGTFDLLGGGLISDMMKYSHLDDAGCYISEVQSLLHQFHSELSDIKMDENINIQIDGFTKFADYFFDGLLADWMVQSKINSSISSVAELHSKVDSVLSKLKQLKSVTETSLQQAKLELENFVQNNA
ncbi:AAA family ATPase [Anaerocolumna xylanovorans]|uniref:Uncharacterized protein n=1 Tax=Anaerocolumna xylanovorans DSM 12503 TaxID=1121345 RepID=A0A1M7XZJ2_9FIRM|nr:hypothetical protein [Anaerocolumna xylanovorans]SHO44623.1 hypothetical protein SAMN02745217_00667 [Anaerocolumna xylanovorans DSM 12503]